MGRWRNAKDNMPIEIINPTDKQHWLECRSKDITSTEISALFGLSPYMTEFELWHNKKNQTIVKIEENVRMKWGTALQDAIAAQIAKENNWTVRRMDEYMRDPLIRAGASFDFSIEPADTWKIGNIPNDVLEPMLLEIKNVDGLQYKNQWTINEDGSIEAPLHIEIQVQHQLMVSGRQHCYIGALIGGNDLVMIKRELDVEVVSAIKRKIAKFWESIDLNQPPQPNFEKDADFIAKLYGYAEPNKVIDMTNNEHFRLLAYKYKEASDQAKQAEAIKDAVKAEMLTMMGDAEKVEGGWFSISAGLIGEAPISYVRKSYRTFKPYWRKQK